MNIWPFRKREDASSQHTAERELDKLHATLRTFEDMCSADERDAYMAELYRQGYQGGCVFPGVMYQACRKASPDKMRQAEIVAASASDP